MKELMIYVHIPFCEKKCNYCDFVSFHADYHMVDNYINTLLLEIEAKKSLANDYIVKSIYIGGGTPSFIESKHIKFILESIKTHYKISDDIEISIEVNPGSANLEKLKTYKESGINRLSIGLQSANDDELKTLGRIHSFTDFLDTYDNALHIGFNNINIDLINCIPDSTPESYRKSLQKVLTLAPKHLSIYNLIIEQGTPFYDKYRPMDQDEVAKYDLITKELTTLRNYNRYEISNYAKAGFECRHNLGYWSFTEYLGFGLNSSSFYKNVRYKNKLNINDYLKLDYGKYIFSNENDYYEEIIKLDKDELIKDYIITGFRKIKGINLADFKNKFDVKLTDRYDELIQKFVSLGYIKYDDNYIWLTESGIDVSNKILSEFI